MLIKRQFLLSTAVFVAFGLFAPHSFAQVATQTPAVSARVNQVMKIDEVNSRETIAATLLEGVEQRKNVVVENAPTGLKQGDTFFVVSIPGEYTNDGNIRYEFADYDRLSVDYFLIGLFVLCALLVGGKQGLRGIVSLVGSILLIIYILLPGIAHGYSPALLSAVVSFLVIVFGSYVTHGFNKATSAAVAGMLITLVFTAVLAYFSIQFAHLSGYFAEGASDFYESGIYTNYDFQSLLFGAILVGILGVLIDIAVGQAVAVEELIRMDPLCSRRIIYERGIRIGREHIGTLINILAILYVASALPLLLLYYTSSSFFYAAHPLINQEGFSTEIIRVMIESIGLILAVPITTLLSVFLLTKKQDS